MYRDITGTGLPDSVDVSEFYGQTYCRWNPRENFSRQEFEELIDSEVDAVDLEPYDGFTSGTEYRNGSTVLRFYEPKSGRPIAEVESNKDFEHFKDLVENTL